MIVLFLLCLIILVVLLQRGWADRALARLHYSVSWDPPLAEPEEPVTLTSQLENRGRLPVMYARLVEELPACAVILEDEAWQQAHLMTMTSGLFIKSTT